MQLISDCVSKRKRELRNREFTRGLECAPVGIRCEPEQCACLFVQRRNCVRRQMCADSLHEFDRIDKSAQVCRRGQREKPLTQCGEIHDRTDVIDQMLVGEIRPPVVQRRRTGDALAGQQEMQHAPDLESKRGA